MFETEQEMSLVFERFLKTNFGSSYIKECRGLFGIPDFVFYTKQQEKVSVISFELKLKNWKKAVNQAFRYKSFSDISYVVLSSESIDVASRNIKMFERYKGASKNPPNPNPTPNSKLLTRQTLDLSEFARN